MNGEDGGWGGQPTGVRKRRPSPSGLPSGSHSSGRQGTATERKHRRRQLVRPLRPGSERAQSDSHISEEEAMFHVAHLNSSGSMLGKKNEAEGNGGIESKGPRLLRVACR